jgi:hypothetical protein
MGLKVMKPVFTRKSLINTASLIEHTPLDYELTKGKRKTLKHIFLSRGYMFRIESIHHRALRDKTRGIKRLLSVSQACRINRYRTRD